MTIAYNENAGYNVKIVFKFMPEWHQFN